MKNNGVDIYYTSHYYSPYEWNKLSNTTNSNLLSDTKSMVATERRSTGDNKRSTNMSSSSVISYGIDEKERAATNNAVVKLIQFNSPALAIGRAGSFPANVIIAISIADVTSAAVTQIFDHNRNPVLNPSSRKIRDKVIGVAFFYTKLRS